MDAFGCMGVCCVLVLSMSVYVCTHARRDVHVLGRFSGGRLVEPAQPLVMFSVAGQQVRAGPA